MKRLILCGEIGCGKSTLIRSALGEAAARAGGFVTLRITENGVLVGFDLAPARLMVQKCEKTERFLDFSHGLKRNDSVFSTFGVELLSQTAPFAVADEFGGLELLVDGFYEGLLALLRSNTPCIGVMKTPSAVAALSRKIPLGQEYVRRAAALRAILEADPETQLLQLSGWQDEHAIKTIQNWVDQYVRRCCRDSSKN